MVGTVSKKHKINTSSSSCRNGSGKQVRNEVDQVRTQGNRNQKSRAGSMNEEQQEQVKLSSVSSVLIRGSSHKYGCTAAAQKDSTLSKMPNVFMLSVHPIGWSYFPALALCTWSQGFLAPGTVIWCTQHYAFLYTVCCVCTRPWFSFIIMTLHRIYNFPATVWNRYQLLTKEAKKMEPKSIWLMTMPN